MLQKQWRERLLLLLLKLWRERLLLLLKLWSQLLLLLGQRKGRLQLEM